MNESRDPDRRRQRASGDGSSDVPPEKEPLVSSHLADRALQNAQRALRLVAPNLPHLAGLASLARIKTCRGVGVAAVGASGLILIEPRVFAEAPLGDLVYVVAHELLHLALNTHGRVGDSPPRAGNIAHDYIINDMLSAELERRPPFGGLDRPGASSHSFEELVLELLQGGKGSRYASMWHPRTAATRRKKRSAGPRGSMRSALEGAGLVEPEQETVEEPEPSEIDLHGLDLISEELERKLEPELSPPERRRVTAMVRDEAARALAVKELERKLEMTLSDAAAPVDAPGVRTQTIEALRAAYATPWELALQRWADASAPGTRTYARPSRRGSSGDVILAGRRREAWTLHIVLDTSGSMTTALPHALGAIAHFCEASGVFDVRIVQCDTDVTIDERTEISGLSDYRIAGFGYSDMTPAMDRLAEDPEVTAVLVLTDGYIEFPAKEPHYRVLWALIGAMVHDTFSPPYGEVVRLRISASL